MQTYVLYLWPDKRGITAKKIAHTEDESATGGKMGEKLKGMVSQPMAGKTEAEIMADRERAKAALEKLTALSI